MQASTIVEIEEGALAVVVGAADGDRLHILRSVRVPLPDTGRDTLVNALRALQENCLQGVESAHVVFGERRLQHFTSKLPRTSPGDAVAFVVREAQRLCGVQTAAEVMVATRLLRQLPGGGLVLATTALARNVFEPIREAFAAVGIELRGLHSMESMLALAATSTDGRPVAVIECSAGRARFVLCDAQSPVQVRRFLIGGTTENNQGAMATHFAMELPRTFDWLRETKQPLPATLLLGTRASIDDASLPLLLNDDLQQVQRAVVPFQLASESLPVPSLGVGMLLSHLVARRPVLSLLDPPRLQLPWNAKHMVALAAALTAGSMFSWSAVVDGRELLRTQAARAAVEREAADLSAELATELGAPVAGDPAGSDGAPDAQAERLRTALSTRRPLSRLLAELSNSAGKELHLEELKFTGADRIEVIGIVQGRSRQDVLAAIAAFSERLGRLPYLVPGGDDEIDEVARQRNCYRFKLGMTWRNS
jgi:hypothetical protein